MPTQRVKFLLLLTASLLAALALRVYVLEADAPLHISMYYGLSNDGAASVAAGRDRVVFGTWWPSWEFGNLYRALPGMSWLGYIFFSLLGAGYWQANFISVVTGVLCIAFVVGFMRQQFGRTAALLSAVFLATNYLLIVFNRTPIVYGTVACANALALYVWGLGLRGSWRWFAVAIVLNISSAFLLKLPAVSLLPALIAGSVIAMRHKISDTRMLRRALLALILGASVLGILAFLLLSPDVTFMIDFIRQAVLARTFNLGDGIVENIRFAVQGPLQFGVYSSFFVRMMPLFLLSFGYSLFQTIKWLARDSFSIPLEEAVPILYLFSTALMLMYARSQATRYMILLIPPMATVAAIAGSRWLCSRRVALPDHFGRLYPILIQLGITFLAYQVLAALLKVWRAGRLDSGFGDFRTILGMSTLYVLLAVALLFGAIGTLLFLYRVVERGQPVVSLPPRDARRAILFTVVLLAVAGDLFQYANFAKSPQYTLVNASRDAGQELPPDAIIGGDYAYPLALENELRAFYFVPPSSPNERFQQRIDSVSFTHLAIGQDGSLINHTQMHERLEQSFPELLPHLRLISKYELRDNLVHVYELVE